MQANVSISIQIEVSQPMLSNVRAESAGLSLCSHLATDLLALHPVLEQSTVLIRLVHLHVEVRSEELLAPALLCHKEPARRIQRALVLGVLERAPL